MTATGGMGANTVGAWHSRSSRQRWIWWTTINIGTVSDGDATAPTRRPRPPTPLRHGGSSTREPCESRV